MARTYKYKAVDQQGKIRSDIIEADNVMELEQRLNGMGMDLITCKPARATMLRIKFSREHISRADLINFAFQMEQLTRAGVPILEGLADLRDSTTHQKMKDILASLVDEIQGGKTFSQALAVHSSVFDNVFVTLVRVGEESGRLPDVLRDLAETLKWQDEMISHTKKVMIYPAIVTVVVVAVVGFLMTYLVPKLIPFLKDLGGEIPFYTTALINTSDFVAAYWYVLLSLPVIITIVIKSVARKNPDFRLALDSFKLRIWLFGPLMLKIKLARFANYIAMMYTSGITVLDSLRIGRDLVDNARLYQSIQAAIDKIAEGKSISESFKQAELFPPLVIRMIRVGENTGALDTALKNISYFYNREVKESIEKIEPTIGPAMTVILGSLMGWIMLAVLGPVYDTVSKIKF